MIGCFPGSTTPALPPERYFCSDVSNSPSAVSFSYDTQAGSITLIEIKQNKPPFAQNRTRYRDKDSFDKFTEYYGHNIGLKANKSFFFFDGVVIATGSGISCEDSDYDIVTTIFQNQLNDTTIDCFSCSEPNAMNLFPINFTCDEKTIMVDSRMTGYYIPEGNNLKLVRKKMTGSQAVPDNSASFARLVTRTEVAYIDHSDDPDEDSYTYYIIPNTTLRNMIDFAEIQESSNPRFRIMVNNNSAHVVRYYRDGVTAYSVFRNVSGLPGEVYGVSNKAITFSRVTAKNSELSIRWQDKDALTITIRGRISLSEKPHGLIAVRQEKQSGGKYLTFIKLDSTKRKSILRYHRADPSAPYHKP